MGELIIRKVRGMNWMAKVSLVLTFTLILSTFMYQGWYKPKQAQAAAVTFRAVGAYVSGAADLTPVIPATAAAGDMMLMAYGTKPYDDTPTIDQGWTNIGSATDGTVAAGIDVGSMQTRFFYKIHTGSETNPTVTNGTNNVSGAVIIVFQKGASDAWVTPVGAGGGDATAGTAFSVTASSNPGITSGDMLVGYAAIRSDAGTQSSITITATDLTVGAFTESPASDLITTSGGDMAMSGGYVSVSSGTASAAPVYASTLAAAHTGSAYIVRMRVTPPPPTVTTPTATSVASTTATLGANVTSDGGGALTANGTCWALTATPSTNCVDQGSHTTGVFTHSRTGLTEGSLIYYRGYATNSGGTGYSSDGSFYTEPATQASAITFPSVGSTTMTVNWTRGDGDGVIVLMRSGAAVATDPTDGTYTTYLADAAFGSGTAIGAAYVIYKGTGTSVAVTGLTASTTYYVAVYEYKGTVNTSGDAQGTNYKPTPATNSQATCAANQVTGLAAGSATTTSILLTWTSPTTGVNYYNVYRNAGKVSTDNTVTTGSFTDGSTSPTTPLTPSTTYSYYVTGYNTTVACEGTASSTVTKSTLAATPSTPTVLNVDATTLSVAVGTDTNSTEATYAIRINGGAYTNWYIDDAGTPQAVAVWQTKAAWGTRTVTDLTTDITYTFDVKARNGNGEFVETGFGPPVSRTLRSIPINITSCAGCHGYYGAAFTDGTSRNNPAGTFVGSHSKHVISYSKVCSVCHVAPATETAADFKHRDSNIQIKAGETAIDGGYYDKNNNSAYDAGVDNTFAQTNAPSLQTCRNVYCHSQGTSATSNPSEPRLTVSAPITNINWGSAGACNSCHGNLSPAKSGPSYTNGATTWGAAKANSHAKHRDECQKCHNSTTTDGTSITGPAYHTNKIYNIAQGTYVTITSYTYAGAGGTCTAISCHRGDDATWGVAVVARDCVYCHSQTLKITNGPLANGTNTRRAAALEFSNTWSHKRSASPSGTVTKYDCCVCHMEGKGSTTTGNGDTDTTYHGNGYVNLRDPDTGLNIKGVAWSGAGAGSYTSTSLDAKPARFSRDLGSNSLEADTQAIMINQCLHCHDADGASNADARVTSGTYAKPFNTTIAGAGYTGTGVTAGGVLGGVTDINAAFATGNATYHPVSGKQNNWYADADTMDTPWNFTKTGTANNTTYGYLITCWDCHAPSGASGPQTSTVTAHGATATLRDTYTATSGAATPLCVICHKTAVYWTTTTHPISTGGASAFKSLSGDDADLITYHAVAHGEYGGCTVCHGTTKYPATLPARPERAENAHGFNTVPSATDSTYPYTTTTWTSGAKPYSFMRATYIGGVASSNMDDWNYTPGGAAPCINMCGTRDYNYGPGGTY